MGFRLRSTSIGEEFLKLYIKVFTFMENWCLFQFYQRAIGMITHYDISENDQTLFFLAVFK